MVGHGGSSAGSYLADPTSPLPSHCASVVATNTLRVKYDYCDKYVYNVTVVLIQHAAVYSHDSMITMITTNATYLWHLTGF